MNKKQAGAGWRRRAAWALAALLLVALAAWAFRPRPMEVEVAPVRTARFEQTIQEDGRLRLKNRYLIAAPTTAELSRPTLRVGDEVRTGDVLATLAPAAPPMIDARTRRVLEQRPSNEALRQTG